MVCDVAYNNVNNWLWTPFIERGEANRIYIEIKFSMRDCSLFPGTALSCKETFSLLYYEFDAATREPPPWEPESYKLIDRIAADEGRFTSSNEVRCGRSTERKKTLFLLSISPATLIIDPCVCVTSSRTRAKSNRLNFFFFSPFSTHKVIINTEVRSIPVTKKGVYFAFRDQGACISLLAIRVYYITCPEVTASFASFPATPTGRELTSIEQSNGVCVANAVEDAPPKYLCKGDGNWYLQGGGCLCKPGYEANADKQTCNGICRLLLLHISLISLLNIGSLSLVSLHFQESSSAHFARSDSVARKGERRGTKIPELLRPFPYAINFFFFPSPLEKRRRLSFRQI